MHSLVLSIFSKHQLLKQSFGFSVIDFFPSNKHPSGYYLYNTILISISLPLSNNFYHPIILVGSQSVCLFDIFLIYIMHQTFNSVVFSLCNINVTEQVLREWFMERRDTPVRHISVVHMSVYAFMI